MTNKEINNATLSSYRRYSDLNAPVDKSAPPLAAVRLKKPFCPYPRPGHGVPVKILGDSHPELAKGAAESEIAHTQQKEVTSND